MKLWITLYFQWRIQGGQIRPWPPHRSWQWSLAPLGSRKSNDSIVNLSKSKDFTPRIDVGYGFGPPTEKDQIKTLKRSMTKKKFFFWETPKKVVQKFRQKFGPPFLKSSGSASVYL